MEDVSYPFLIQVLVFQLLGIAAQITLELGFEARKDNKLVANCHLLLIESLISDVFFIEFELDCVQELVMLIGALC